MQSKVFGAIEAGGTKFVCAVGTGPRDLQEPLRIDTTGPDETISRVIEYFKEQNSHRKLTAIGIGSFGPIDLAKDSPAYGHITSTPKRDWANTDIVGKIRQAFDIPIGFDTDVNAAAFGEYTWGAGQGLTDLVYLTIGTGIGGGAIINGKLLHGLIHPEMGHISIPIHPDDPYEGTCPFHRNACFEGLASGPAIEARWGAACKELHEQEKVWELEAHYISLALVNYICTLSPQRIILGGGVMEQKQLLPLIHEGVLKKLNNYIQAGEITNELQDYIVLPQLEGKSGVLGAIALARQSEEEAVAQRKEVGP